MWEEVHILWDYRITNFLTLNMKIRTTILDFSKIMVRIFPCLDKVARGPRYNH